MKSSREKLAAVFVSFLHSIYYTSDNGKDFSLRDLFSLQSGDFSAFIDTIGKMTHQGKWNEIIENKYFMPPLGCSLIQLIIGTY